MQYRSTLRALALAAITGTVTAAGATAQSTMPKAPTAPAKNIVQTAIAAGDFTTLVTALKAAGLVQALEGAGPFTVFAPTDDAFKKLPAGTVENLLKPENKARLEAVLKYHVVAGNLTAADLAAKKDKDGYVTLTTLEGAPLKLHLTADGKVHVGDKFANVITANVAASNGVIHAIDGVLLPPEQRASN